MPDRASNAGGVPPASSSEIPLVNREGKPDVVAAGDLGEPYEEIMCSCCLGMMPKIIARHCKECNLHFHPGHYQLHRDNWPCPVVDSNLRRWCDQHIEEEHNTMECSVCLLEMHAECCIAHKPCREGWSKKKKSTLGTAEPQLPAPVTPPTLDWWSNGSWKLRLRRAQG